MNHTYHCSSCKFKKRNNIIPNLKVISIGLFLFFILSMLLTLFLYIQLIFAAHEIAEIGSQNVKLQTQIEYYKGYCEYLEEHYVTPNENQ